MSQKLTPESAQKGFAVGRGLLAAAETLNFSMNESRQDPYGSSSQQHGGLIGLGGVESQDSQLATRRVGNHLGNTMKLFASLGLSPNDLDALAQVPEENISVETLPHLIMQLKNRKAEASRHLSSDLLSQSLSPDPSYRGGRDKWGDMQGGRLDRSTASTSQGRTSQSDFGYSSTQDLSSRSYDMLDYGSSGSSRDRQYSELSSDRYRGLGTTSSSASDDLFMQRRMGYPSQGKIQDFLGVMPHMFPHVCSLCDFDVHSSMEWTQHTTGMRHAENRRVLLQLYPDWDPQMPSGRMSDTLSLSSKNRSDGLLGVAPSSMRQRSSMGSNWGSPSSMSLSNKSSYSSTPKIRSRVVVVKYDEKPKLSALFALASRFGAIREHLVLKNKAFLELATHEEALAMTNHYQNKPATLHGRDVKIYLSKDLLVIEKNDRPDRDNRNRDSGPVVFFSNLPRETEKKAELLTVARRFGTVVNHLFLNDQAFVQMGNSEDAEMLVKYYTIHPLTISRRTIHMNICTKYKTLTVVPGKGEQLKEELEEPGQKNSSSSRTSSKSSSKPQRSSNSRPKESSSEKAQESKSKEGEVEVPSDAGSGDEVQGVVEAHDEEEKALDEDLVTEDSVAAQADQEAAMEFEDSAMEPEVEEEEEEENAHDGEDTETPEEEAFEQKHQTEQPVEHAEDQEQEDNAEPKETDGQDDVEQDEGAADDSLEQEVLEESDFPEDFDEFVTLDELAEEDESELHDSRSRERPSAGRSRDSGGLRVVNVVGFKRGYGYLDEILSLAKPFGKVVRHLVLHSRPEAFLEFSSEQEARSMVRFYNGNVIPSVCGKTVKIYHSMTYATIQSGKVVYIGHIPPFKSSDASFLKIAEPFGKVRRYYLNRSRCECFIEMERGEDAERFVESARLNPLKFEGKRLLVYISRKYKQLKHGHRPPTSEDKRPAKREHSEEREEIQSSSTAKTTTVIEEEPPSKKAKEETPSEDKDLNVPQEEEKEEEKEVEVKESCENIEEVNNEHTEEHNTDATESQNEELQTVKDESDIDGPPTEFSSVDISEKSQEPTETSTPETESVKKPETTTDTLGPYEPNVPVGVEFVRMGYYCRLCFLFYSNEDTAKKVHCGSQAHYEKLKKHLEKKKNKAQNNREKN
ncbi:matrin 3-like 1.2 [Tachysurus vachellii]|uniref:matrin 3-like 1.2 n=1 Tax=Tachysurus vachellii TaxID=175792 RepID=UPI00296B3DDE|nr:matrin 3-like 1.2 [Tachysurus vachellii]XP_060741573.1 matrin 3-like 1.2 [Tachysurus vachellii]